MALTKTRTRTQTALTQLVETLANLKGELAFVEGWLAEPEVPAELSARREVLRAQMEALATTLQVFDPGLDVGQVAPIEEWRKAYRVRSAKSLRTRYLRLHHASVSAALYTWSPNVMNSTTGEDESWFLTNTP